LNGDILEESFALLSGTSPELKACLGSADRQDEGHPGDFLRNDDMNREPVQSCNDGASQDNAVDTSNEYPPSSSPYQAYIPPAQGESPNTFSNPASTLLDKDELLSSPPYPAYTTSYTGRQQAQQLPFYDSFRPLDAVLPFSGLQKVQETENIPFSGTPSSKLASPSTGATSPDYFSTSVTFLPQKNGFHVLEDPLRSGAPHSPPGLPIPLCPTAQLWQCHSGVSVYDSAEPPHDEDVPKYVAYAVEGELQMPRAKIPKLCDTSYEGFKGASLEQTLRAIEAIAPDAAAAIIPGSPDLSGNTLVFEAFDDENSEFERSDLIHT